MADKETTSKDAPTMEHDSEPFSDSETDWFTLTFTHRKEDWSMNFPEGSTVVDLFKEIESACGIPISNQKILVPKGPMIKAPFKDPDMQLKSLEGKKLMLMGTPAEEIQAVNSMSERVAKRNAARLAAHRSNRQRAQAAPRRDQARASDDAKYTFLQVRPLQGLPHPERSQALLMKLKEDPGIRASMRKHKFTVSLLTEMEPLSHTQSTHEGTSRILGLNRNQGEVIELRLRTDAHDGYRDYKTIRNTLCHELAHNVHGPHDRQFWDLCHQIEREVQAADWKSGGQTVDGDVSRYAISGAADADADEEEYPEDHGGWTGGEFVLGGVLRDERSSAGLSRREILAQAALERQRKESESECKAEKGWRPCQRGSPHSSDEK
ncbi:Ubiquitin and WLM domain-containing metalloprotease [Paramyrothecium foliicola]|nr:Ubiquitin and WLM domain-containing metalloprotease [Paramyrothecium foliicola]